MASLALGVKFTPASTGAGSFVYSAAIVGYMAPSAYPMVDGKTYRYRAESTDLSQWEFGSGVWTAATGTLTRVVSFSSTGGTVSFSTIPMVGITAFPADVLQFDDAMTLTTAQKAQAQSNLLLVPTMQIFLTGSGTYTPTSTNVRFIRVIGQAGGGGGSGSGLNPSVGGGNGTGGGATTFGSSLLTANGGVAGAYGAGGVAGGAGGTATIGAGATGMTIIGGSGGGGIYQNSTTHNLPGGVGGSSFLGGAGWSQAQAPGGAGAANTGGGGAGGGCNAIAQMTSGSGGGAGGAFKAIITSLLSSYAYSVGPGGSGGSAGTSGFVGGSGGSGGIWIEEYYGT
jgi:hypothetical protein